MTSSAGRVEAVTSSSDRSGARAQAIACAALIVASIGAFASPPVANVGVVLALLAALASRPLRARLIMVARQPLGRAALGLLAAMSLAMTWAAVPWPERFAAWWNWRTMLVIVLAAAVFGDARSKQRYVEILVAATALAAIVSFVLWGLHRPIGDNEPGVFLRNHVTQSMAMMSAVVLAGMRAVQGIPGARSRLVFGAAGLVCLANLAFVAAGRSGQVGLLAAAVAAALMLLKGRRLVLALAAVPLVAATLVAASPMLQQRFALVAQEAPTLNCAGQENSTGLRLLLWRTTIDLIGVRPVFGYGVGGFTPAFAARVGDHLEGQRAEGWCARPAHDPHNQYLRVTVEAGALGLIALLGFVGGAFCQRAAQPYRVCALALLAAWCVTSLFNSHLQTFNEGHMIALMLGALLAPDQPASADSTADRTLS
jgi:O-antigen ligase